MLIISSVNFYCTADLIVVTLEECLAQLLPELLIWFSLLQARLHIISKASLANEEKTTWIHSDHANETLICLVGRIKLQFEAHIDTVTANKTIQEVVEYVLAVLGMSLNA